ncbi:MAG TPA: ABC transporter permease [Gemmatimonadaceae bacterium]|nr:ABC transporter permease [Gemmatimonadaceae bacterium]
MPEYERTRARGMAERVYRVLLHLYPRAFRDEFGDAMIEFYRDRLARTKGRDRALAGLHAMSDLARNAIPARIDDIGQSIAVRRRQRLAPALAPSLASTRREDRMLASILQDLRYALRGMRRAPSFALTVCAILAIGIGASVAVFSVVNGVLLKALPYADPGRIVRLQHHEPYSTVSEPEFVDYKREVTALQYLAAYISYPATLAAKDAEPERLRAASVSEDFFPVLGSRMWLGRPFAADEQRRGGPFSVVLSHSLWTRRFGSDSSIIGREITFNERNRTVVGVLAPGHSFPGPEIAVWTPMRLNYDTLWTRNNHYLQLIGRLAPEGTIERARLQSSELAKRFVRDFPTMYAAGKPVIVTVSPLSNALVAETRPYIVTLFIAVTLVLMIACVNVANLMLARGEVRRRDVAIRTAMGASRYRVVRQALTESLVLALFGGAAGVLIATGTVRALRAVIPASVPRASDVSVDFIVLAFAVGITVITGVLCGVVPAFRVARDDASDTLKEGGRSAGAARARGRVRRALAISEIALAVVTLTGAGLMMRSLWNMNAIDLGFSPDNVLAVQVSPPARFVDQQATELYERLLARVRALPGVQSVGAVEDLPISDGNSIWSIAIDDMSPNTSVADAPAAMPQKVTAGYFDVMRVPTVRGRTFTDADRADAPLVAVVNETMARKMWPGKDAIGGMIRMLNPEMPKVPVVGIVKDVRSSGVLTDPPPTMYFPSAQARRSVYYVPTQMWLVVRTTGDPRSIAGQVRSIVREVEPSTPIARLQTMNEAVAASVAPRRFTSLLLAGFAMVALVLAGLGIYSVISYSVSQRRAEMGIRMALGASRGALVGQVLGEGARTAALGALFGVLLAMAATRLLRSMVVGVSPTDPLTLGAVAAVLLLVALAASYFPARRASRVDPALAIRAE